MRAKIGGGDIVDPDNLDPGPATLCPCAQHRPPDPSESVDIDPHLVRLLPAIGAMLHR